MLRSLAIRNYRNLVNVELSELSRINLIVGKNNTGKTSLLECIAIYVNKGDVGFLLQLLTERGENYIKYGSDSFSEEDVFRTFLSLFNGREAGYGGEGIAIGELDMDLFGDFSLSHESKLRLKIVGGANREFDNFNTGFNQDELFQLNDKISDMQKGLLCGFKNNVPRVYSFSRFSSIGRFYSLSEAKSYGNFHFIKTGNIEREANSVLWDKIALTQHESEVVNALKIVENKIERIAFIAKDERKRNNERVPVVKLVGSHEIIPLKSMGDGINRILTIILAMINSENGYFLIDEFENGLHYSVQEKLWEIIQFLSYRLNIQVFATTHSSDTIKSFSSVIQKDEIFKDSMLIKLVNRAGSIRQESADANDLKVLVINDIDPR